MTGIESMHEMSVTICLYSLYAWFYNGTSDLTLVIDYVHIVSASVVLY